MHPGQEGLTVSACRCPFSDTANQPIKTSRITCELECGLGFGCARQPRSHGGQQRDRHQGKPQREARHATEVLDQRMAHVASKEGAAPHDMEMEESRDDGKGADRNVAWQEPAPRG